MKKKNIMLVIFLVSVFVFASGCSLFPRQEETKNENKEGVETLEEKIEKKLSEMTLDEKIGQMLVISYRSPIYSEKLDTTLKTIQPGGFILFQENITTYEETVSYIKKIKETSKIPMFIGIDQEGGRVQRIKSLEDANVLSIPPMLEVGKTNNKDLAKEVGRVLGEEISSFGINLDYAPVLDIYSNPLNTVIGNRSFGTNYQTVVNMAFPFSEGLKESGIIPVFKHFPGHGDTEVDSHQGLPIVTKTKEELYERELIPFEEAIKNNAEMIMVGHIALPNITNDNTPASLSRVVITDILRGEMGFTGVVTTDALEMKAITDSYTTKEIMRLAINAGVDLLLMPTESKDAVESIHACLEEGTVTEEQINASVARILTLKYKKHLGDDALLSKENIGTKEHIDIINQVK